LTSPRAVRAYLVGDLWSLCRFGRLREENKGKPENEENRNEQTIDDGHPRNLLEFANVRIRRVEIRRDDTFETSTVFR
jgi:hypothetical protein